MIPKDIFSKHHHIAIDFDDTLIDTFSSLLTVSHQSGKLLEYRNIEDIQNYHIEEDKNIKLSKNEVDDIWKNYWDKLVIEDDIWEIYGSYKTLRKLIDQWIQCSILTARNKNHEKKKKQTEMWIKLYFPELINRIHYLNNNEGEWKKKSEICKTLGITLLIDDAFENAIDMVENGLSAILLEKPWNREITFEHKNLYRTKNWEEIYSIL